MSRPAVRRLVAALLCVAAAMLLVPGHVSQAWAQPAAPGTGAPHARPGAIPPPARPGSSAGAERRRGPGNLPIPGRRSQPSAPAAGHEATPAAGHGDGHAGADDERPPSINLVQGWLGVNNTKAVPPPPGARVGSWNWWAWRLTPYPWRYVNEADPHDARNQPVPLVAPVLNFGVLLLLLWRFGRKPLREGLQKRAAAITAEIDAAKAIKREARKRLRSYQAEIDHLDDRTESLRRKYAEEAAAEQEALAREAAQARERMLSDADFRIVQEGKEARNQVSREAMEQALVAAEALLQARVTPADLDRLAEEYLSFVGPALRHGAGVAREARP